MSKTIDHPSKQLSLMKWRLILGKKAEKQKINYDNISPDMLQNYMNPPSFDQRSQSSQSQSKQSQSNQSQTQRRGSSSPTKLPKSKSKKTQSSSNYKKTTSKYYAKQSIGKVKKSNSKNSAPPSTQKSGKKSHNKGGKNGASNGNHRKSIRLNPKGSGNSDGKKKRPGMSMNKGQNAQNFLSRIDTNINFVYSPPNTPRSGSRSGSGLNIPIWLKEVKELFPKQTREVLERDLVKNSKIEDIIQHPELFDKVEPNMEMLGVLLRMKNMLPNSLRDKAKGLVEKVVKQLVQKLKSKFKRTIIGAINRNLHSPVKCFRNIDWKQTIRQNLKNFNPKLNKMIVETPRFYSCQKKRKHWQIIIMIDESGSMTESIIYSAVIASIFAELPAIKTNLIIFDTEVVDLSDQIGHPVDVLMNTTLSGGTNIAKALHYGQTLMTKPQNTLFILITDFYEGGGYHNLDKEIIHILESQARLLALAALGRNAEPMYDRRFAQKLKSMGIDVLACTPEELAPIVGKILES